LLEYSLNYDSSLLRQIVLFKPFVLVFKTAFSINYFCYDSTTSSFRVVFFANCDCSLCFVILLS